jgi:hypothetical protein
VVVPKQGWLAATGQTWKYWLGAAICLPSVGLLVVFATTSNAMSLVWAVGLMVADCAVGLTWIALSIRCPRCGRAVGAWYLLHGKWDGFLVATRCPICNQEAPSPAGSM